MKTDHRKSGISIETLWLKRVANVNAQLAEAVEGRSPQTWRYWPPVCAYAGFIFYLSSLSHPGKGFYFLPFFFVYLGVLGDKIIHLVEYGVLGILFYRAFRYAGGARAARFAVGLAILASAAYGLTDEIHQVFVPSREADPWDLLADTLGASIAVIGWHQMALYLRRPRHVSESLTG